MPAGLKDGPLPTHFEPLESPLSNSVVKRQTNPPEHWFPRDDNRFAPPADPRFPHVLTTFRLTEHHTGGGMSRTLTHLAELQPEQFLELSPELAATIGVATGDWVSVVTLRSAVEARAMVTRRMRPLIIDGRTVHQVALPFHWGWSGLVKGDVTNDLIAISGEPNVTIQESKALTCRVERGRRRRGAALVEWIEALVADSKRHPEEERRPKGGGS